MRIKAVTTGMISAALLVTFMGTPAAIATGDGVLPSSEVVEEFSDTTFSVAGDLDLAVGESVEISDLEAVGVEESIAEAVINEPDTEVAPQLKLMTLTEDAPEVTVAAVNAPVLYTWRDRDNKTVNLRSNINAKLVKEHNVNYKVARATTQHPTSKWLVSGTKYNYRTPVNKVRCSGFLWWRKCTVVRTVNVRAGVDFRTTTSDGRPFGVTTTYCENIQGKCPDFVKNALNI